MFEWFKKKVKIIPETEFGLFAESIEDQEAGSQQSYDFETPRFFPTQYGILPPFDLNKFLSLYLNDSLAHACVMSSVFLTTSAVEVTTDSQDLKQYIEDFNRRIEIERVIYKLALDCEIFGFALAEIVGDGSGLMDSSRIIGVQRIDPRSILIVKDNRGRFKFFRQRPIVGSHGIPVDPGSSFPTFDTLLDPDSIIFVSNDSPLTVYGQSILKAPEERFKQRRELIESIVKAAKKFANPIILWSYHSDKALPESSDEIVKKRASLKDAIVKLRNGDSDDIFAAGTGEFTGTIIGPASLPDLQKQCDLLTADIVISCGLSPSTMGYNLGTGVTTSDASGRITVNNITVKQQRIISALKAKLWDLLPYIESECPDGSFVCNMASPTLETMTEREQTMTIKINNALLLLKSGGYSAQDAASYLGLLEWADEQKLSEYLTVPEPTRNQDDPNQTQQDAKVNQLNDGKEPSNNPSGKKGTMNQNGES